MAFANVENIPVSEVDTSIDVVSLGDGSHEHDAVKVTAALKLGAEIDSEQEAFLILPLASSAQSKPIVRYVDDPVKEAQVFEFDDLPRSEYDAELVERWRPSRMAPRKKSGRTWPFKLAAARKLCPQPWSASNRASAISGSSTRLQRRRSLIASSSSASSVRCRRFF